VPFSEGDAGPPDSKAPEARVLTDREVGKEQGREGKEETRGFFLGFGGGRAREAETPRRAGGPAPD